MINSDNQSVTNSGDQTVTNNYSNDQMDHVANTAKITSGMHWREFLVKKLPPPLIILPKQTGTLNQINLDKIFSFYFSAPYN